VLYQLSYTPSGDNLVRPALPASPAFTLVAAYIADRFCACQLCTVAERVTLTSGSATVLSRCIRNVKRVSQLVGRAAETPFTNSNGRSGKMTGLHKAGPPGNAAELPSPRELLGPQKSGWTRRDPTASPRASPAPLTAFWGFSFSSC